MDFSSPTTWQVISMACALGVVLTSGYAALLTFTQQEAQTREIKGWLTGGDSFPHLYPRVEKDATGKDAAVAYYLKLHGKTYPLYDVQVRLQDLDNGPFLPDGSVIPSKIVRAGTLTNNTDKFTMDFLVFEFPKPGETKPRRVKIELPARNGLVLQEITLTPYQGRWITKSKPITKDHQPIDVDIQEIK
jgi:hypothetical protein